MKTVKEIENQIKENAVVLAQLYGDVDARIEVKRNKTKIRTLKKENQLLRQCALYLKTSPREEYLKKELQTIKDRVSSIDSHFGEWAKWNSGKFKNLRSAYKTQMGILKLQLQIRTLKYLLA